MDATTTDSILGTQPEQDLNQFEILAVQSFWLEAEVKNGVEIQIETFEENGQTFHGYAIFHTVHGPNFLAGFLACAYALETSTLQKEAEIAAADAALTDAAFEYPLDSRHVA